MKYTIPALFLVFIFYLLFFPVQLRPELTLRPTWAIDVARAPIERTPQPVDASVIPFDVAGLFGYVSLDGKLLHREEKLFGLAIDGERYINFPNVPENLVIHDNRGRITDSVAVSAYPMLRDGRLFLVPTNRAGISELGAAGRPVWEREYTSVVTDLDVQGGLVAVGLLDSRIQILDALGEVTLELDMKGSRINAVYGCALSDDATSAAVIHGIDPQYLTIVDIAGSAAEIVDYRLKSEFRKPRYVRFFDSDRYLLVEEREGVEIFDLADGTEYQIPTTGSFAAAGDLKKNGLLWLISQGERSGELVVIAPPQRILFRTVLAGAPWALSENERLILGIDGQLCALKEEIR